MATQKCPKCRSTRVRMGYRPTSIFSKLIFRYHLLCDDCNWEFSGFAIPGTVPKKTRKRKNAVQNTENFNQKNKEIDLIEEILSNNNTTENSSVSFVSNDRLNSLNRKDSQEASQITSTQNLEEIKPIQVEEKFIETDEENNDGLKRQKVKKKVKVKYY